MSYGPGGKRQKVREARSTDNVDYFQGIEKIDYNNLATSTDVHSFRYYNCNERVHNRSMEEWLKFSVSLTEFRSNGSDSQGRPTLNRSWDDHSNSIDNYKRCIKAFYDFCHKLGVRYWTAFDTDLVPQSDNWEENKTNWDEIVEFICESSQRYQMKLLWLAPDLHSHPKYSTGAFTSNEASTFVQAATQIKKCIEMSQRLNAECFLLWPYREGYEAVFQTDVAREIKLFAKLLKITAEYKERLNFKYKYYKVCTPPGHHMYMACVYNMFGGISITNRFDCSDIKTATLMVKCIADQGSAPIGGINLRIVPKRDSDLRDLFTSYISYMDVFAKGLRVACNVVAEQVFTKHIQQRYSSYSSGFGSRVVSGDVSIEECEEFYKKNHGHEVACTKVEHYNMVFQRYLDTCDHI